MSVCMTINFLVYIFKIYPYDYKLHIDLCVLFKNESPFSSRKFAYRQNRYNIHYPKEFVSQKALII